MRLINCPSDLLWTFLKESKAEKADDDLYDLAGNAFSGTVCLAIQISIFLHIDPGVVQAWKMARLGGASKRSSAANDSDDDAGLILPSGTSD